MIEPPAFQIPNTTPLAELRKALAATPDRCLLAWEDGVSTVVQLASQAARLAAALERLQIGRGSRVALMMRNRPEFFGAQYGIWMTGGVEVSVNPDLRGPSLAHVLRDSDPTIVIADPDSLTAIEEADPGIPRDVPVIAVEDERLWGTPLPDSEWADPGPGDLASILYTSGTTGPSKGVMLPHAYFVNHAAILADSQQITGSDVLYSPLAFCHIDQHIYLPTCLLTGATLTFRARFSRSNFWADIERFEATWFAAVGWILAAVAGAPAPTARQYASLRRAVAAPITADLYEFFEDRLGVPMGSMFGQTEADGIAFAAPGAHKRGSAGRAHPAFELRVADPDGVPMPVDEVGEIQYRPKGANLLTMGYWERPDATVEAWRDLWFHTGDYGRLDGEGFLWFAGRMTDSLRRRGENISAYELEGTIKALPGIRDCAAVATPDEAGGEDEIKLVLVLEDGAELDPDQFSELCAGSLPRFAQPRYVEVVPADELIRGPGTGAIQKRLLSTDTAGAAVIDLHA